MATLSPINRQRRGMFGTNFNQRFSRPQPQQFGGGLAPTGGGTYVTKMPGPPPGYAPGGTGGPGFLGMEYQYQMDEANRKNDDRYNQTLGEFGGLRNRSMDRVSSLGRQAANDIASFGYDNIQAGMQDLTSRGLSGSTLGAGVRGRVQREVGRSYGNLYDQLTQTQLGADMATTGNIAGVMERRNDVQPDFNQMIGLAQGMGQYSPYGVPSVPGGGFRNPMMGGGMQGGYGMPPMQGGYGGYGGGMPYGQQMPYMMNKPPRPGFGPQGMGLSNGTNNYVVK